MAPYLDTVKVSERHNHPQGRVSDGPVSCQSFADVPITDAGVDTVVFLQAADGLVGLFGRSRNCCVDNSLTSLQISLDQQHLASCNLIYEATLL